MSSDASHGTFIISTTSILEAQAGNDAKRQDIRSVASR